MAETRESEVEVVLVGGPTELPERCRVPRSAVAGRKLKIPLRGGREHFELAGTGDLEGAGRPVFRWTMRTEAAE